MISDQATIGCRYNCRRTKFALAESAKDASYFMERQRHSGQLTRKVSSIGSSLRSPDVLCVQETKAHEVQLPKALKQVEGYSSWFTTPERKGYSGVGLYTREEHRSQQRHLRPWRRSLRQ